MRKLVTTTILTLIVSLQILQPLMAQSWRSSLYPEDWTSADDKSFYTDKIIQDWSFAGYRRGEVPLPEVTTNILDVTKSPYNADNTGGSDVTSIIQQAIDDAGNAGGGVVYLPSGTFRVSLQSGGNYCLRLNKSNVVLRGAGTNNTFLYNHTNDMRSNKIIYISNGGSWSSTGSDKVDITQDLTNPTRVIPVTDVSNYTPGDMVIVRNYVGARWIAEHNMTSWWGGYENNFAGLVYCREVMEVDAVNKTLTIDIPIRYSLLTADEAAVYKAPTSMIDEVGIENLSIGNRDRTDNGWAENDYTNSSNGSYHTHASWVIDMRRTFNCWVNNVNTYRPAGNASTSHLLSNGILLSETKNITIKECHFQRPQFGGGGGNGYMFRVSGNESLLTNCTAEFQRHGFVVSHMISSGNVFHQCADIDGGKQTGLDGDDGTNGKGSDHHMHFSHSMLFDQCTVTNSYFDVRFRPYGSDPKHCLTGAHSAYWNTTSNGNQGEAVRTQQGRYGYVIGTSGTKTNVNTGEFSSGTAYITDPVDHTEGLGSGAMLVPASLYQDQLSKRLGQISFCQTVSASSNDGNLPSNVLDNDINTRWSAEGNNQWLQFCFGIDSIPLQGIAISFFNGNVRSSNFDIESSFDGETWTSVMANVSSNGTSVEFEEFLFLEPIWSKYLRIVGHGNSVNLWNSYTEVRIDTAHLAHGDIAHLVPGIIELEDYNQGGQMIGYFDSDQLNEGGEYRSDGVDIQVTGDDMGEYNVGWTEIGEWLNYTIDVSTEANYDIVLRTASLANGGTVKLTLDGADITSNIDLPVTGDWQLYDTTLIPSILFPEGEHVLRLIVIDDGVNMNLMSIEPSVVTGVETSEKNASRVFPTLIQDDQVLTIEAAAGSDVYLVNMLGHSSRHKLDKSGVIVLQYAELPKGIFVVSINGADEIEKYQVVKR